MVDALICGEIRTSLCVTSSPVPPCVRWRCTRLRVSLGTPSAVYGLVYNNWVAGLTHDPTAMSPVIVVVGHVSLRDCWRTGLSASVLNLANWLPVGLP